MDDIIGVVVSILSRQFVEASERLRKEDDSNMVDMSFAAQKDSNEETISPLLTEFQLCVATYRAVQLTSKNFRKFMNRVLIPIRARRVFTRTYCDSISGIFEITPDGKCNGVAGSFIGSRIGFYVNGEPVYIYDITHPKVRFREAGRTKFTRVMNSQRTEVKITDDDLTIIIDESFGNRKISLQLTHYGLRITEIETSCGYHTVIEPVDSLPMYILKFYNRRSRILDIPKDAKLSTYVLEGHLAAEDLEAIDIMTGHLAAYGYEFLDS